ncbi:MAG: aa3-type cytochrome c oxidase subunit IV [Kiloniellaceae bacterium]
MADDEILEARRKTWHGFVKLIAFCVAAIALALVLMALFLT